MAEPQNTDSEGNVRFANLLPGNYIVCEIWQFGWLNTAPGSFDADYGQPCYRLTVASGQAVSVRFGNQMQPTAQSSASTGIAMSAVRTGLLPDTDDEGNLVAPESDLWANEENADQTGTPRYQFFIPLALDDQNS